MKLAHLPKDQQDALTRRVLKIQHERALMQTLSSQMDIVHRDGASASLARYMSKAPLRKASPGKGPGELLSHLTGTWGGVSTPKGYRSLNGDLEGWASHGTHSSRPRWDNPT